MGSVLWVAKRPLFLEGSLMLKIDERGVGNLLSPTEHREIGAALRRAERVTRKLGRRIGDLPPGSGARPINGVLAGMENLLDTLHEAWVRVIGQGCRPDDHSPYYTDSEGCSHCNPQEDPTC